MEYLLKNQILSFADKRKISKGMRERSKNNDKRGEKFEAELKKSIYEGR
jgi:hypothetical protein